MFVVRKDLVQLQGLSDQVLCDPFMSKKVLVFFFHYPLIFL